MVVELRPHQTEAVKKMHNGCILFGGVGVGKSITALAYFFEEVCGGVINNWDWELKKVDLYVITTAKKRDLLDWEHEALKFGITKYEDDNVNGINMVVDSWNNIDKYKDVKDAFFIFDEQRLVGSGAWTKAFIKIAKSNEWVLLSATPGDTWLDYIPVFVANGFYKNRTEFKHRHVVYNTYSKFPKVDRYLETGHLLRLRNQLLVHMPYERHTTRHSRMVEVSYDQQLFKKVVDERWHVYEKRPLRDVAEQLSVMRKVVNSDASRLEAVRSLIKTHPRLIVFYNFDYELEILRTLASSIGVPTAPSEIMSGANSGLSMETKSNAPDAELSDDPWKGTIWEKGWDQEEELRKSWAKGLPNDGQTSKTLESNSRQCLNSNSRTGSGIGLSTSHEGRDLSPSQDESIDTTGFQIAEWNGHKHQPIPTTDRWVYLVQYQAGAEGWNCTETDTVVFYSLTYSYKLFHQAHGRIDRLNTPYRDLWYVTLMSKSAIDVAVRKSLRNKQSFNESSIAPKW